METEKKTTKSSVNKENATTIRDSLVNTAVQFLQNPNTHSSPLQMRKEFLKKKGLTDEEIELAVERSGIANYTQQSSSVMKFTDQVEPAGYHPYRFMPVQRPPSRILWLRDVANTVVAVGGAAYLCYWVCKTYVEPYLFGRKKDPPKKDPLEVQIMGVKNCVERMAGIMERLESKLEYINVLANTEQELTSQINSLKGLLLNRKQFPGMPPIVGSTAPASIPAWQLPENTACSVEDKKLDNSPTNSSNNSSNNDGSDSSLEMIKVQEVLSKRENSVDSEKIYFS